MGDNPLQEHQEAAEQAHEGNKRAALLVAALAAILALSEQGAKHAEMRVDDSSIAATDTWAQYQAKSTRVSMAHDFADLVAAFPAPADPQAAARMTSLQARLATDLKHYDSGPDGRPAIATHAADLEHARDHALSRAHAFDNAAASLELGIVLVTASVIVGVTGLLWFGAALGALGVVLAVLALVAPSIAAF
jgi:hypothetical protein